MLSVIAMNTETKLAKKRGPKPSGVDKEVLFMRVPVGMRDKLKEMCKGVLSGEEVDLLCEGTTAFKGVREPKKDPALAQMLDVPDSPSVKAKVSEIAALLDDIQKLTDERDGLVLELEECRNLTYDEKMGYWKERALRAEAYAASKNDHPND